MKRVVFTALVLATVSAPVLADQALASSKNCLACHGVANKVVGPGFKDVAAKYASDKGAADMLAVKIQRWRGQLGCDPHASQPAVERCGCQKTGYLDFVFEIKTDLKPRLA
jgi:cytochrome c